MNRATSSGHLALGLGTRGRPETRPCVLSFNNVTGMTQDMVRPNDDPKQEILQMRVSATYSKSIDDWRRKQPDLPLRSEAIRRLTAMALSTAASPAKTRERKK